MKKGFKKFLGAMAVLSIFGGSVGIGASAASALYSSGFGRDLAESAEIGINDLRSGNVAPVASMTPEEVKLMDDWAEFTFILCEMAGTDPSQWGNFLVKLEKLYESINKSVDIFLSMKRDPDLILREHYSKKESWKRAVSLQRSLFSGSFYFFHSRTVHKLFQWLEDRGVIF